MGWFLFQLRLLNFDTCQIFFQINITFLVLWDFLFINYYLIFTIYFFVESLNYHLKYRLNFARSCMFAIFSNICSFVVFISCSDFFNSCWSLERLQIGAEFHLIAMVNKKSKSKEFKQRKGEGVDWNSFLFFLVLCWIIIFCWF